MTRNRADAEGSYHGQHAESKRGTVQQAARGEDAGDREPVWQIVGFKSRPLPLLATHGVEHLLVAGQTRVSTLFRVEMRVPSLGEFLGSLGVERVEVVRQTIIERFFILGKNMKPILFSSVNFLKARAFQGVGETSASNSIRRSFPLFSYLGVLEKHDAGVEDAAAGIKRPLL